MLKRTLSLLPFALAAAFSTAQTTLVLANNQTTGDAVPATGSDTFVQLVNNPGFGYNNIRTGTTGINDTYARSGNSSVRFNFTDGTGSNGKGDIEFYNVGSTGGFASLGRLADLTTFGYDRYRSSTSTVNPTLAPVIRLFVDLDGSFTTTSDQGFVIYEPIYTRQVAGTSTTEPVNTWTTDTTTQNSGRYYSRFRNAAGTFANQFDVQGQLLSYLTDPSTTGLNAPTNNGNAVIYGFNAGVGSGWGAGSFDGAVDNIQIGFSGGSVKTFNFERTSQPVPEPATMAALGFGALALIKRRKKTSK